MNNSRTRSYLYYALGEVILVVIGILIALQINNWNEDRKSRLLERKLLTELMADLEETKADLHTDIAKTSWLRAVHDSLFQSLYVPGSYTGNSPYPLPLASVVQRGKLFPKSSAYASIRSVGITIIRNDSLRNQITELYELKLPRVQGREGIVVKMRNEELLPLLKTDFETGQRAGPFMATEGTGSIDSGNWITVRNIPHPLELTLKLYLTGLAGQQDAYESFLMELTDLEKKIAEELQS